MQKTQFPDLAKWTLDSDVEWQLTAMPYFLQFKKPAGTSRGVMNKKESWFLSLKNKETGRTVVAECGLLRGLSYDDRVDYGEYLKNTCEIFNSGHKIDWYELGESLKGWPSIEFAMETIFQQLHFSVNDNMKLFDSDFVRGEKGIKINGLVWMSDLDDMMQQVQNKIDQNYQCIKIKIASLKWEDEFRLLKEIRRQFGTDLEIRVDANGGFSHCDAIYSLHQLSQIGIHSIEQPIKAGNWEKMRDLCKNSEIDVALDEELIPCIDTEDRIELLDKIEPQYIILKPSFAGGYRGTQEWIELAEERGIGWWITSALESNVGLNAIAQWTACLETTMAQGLGTGGLFTNNFASPLEIADTKLFHRADHAWNLDLLEAEQSES